MAATDPMMRYETWPNLVTMFFEKAAERSGKPFLWAKSGGVYKPLSWGETAALVRAMAAELKAQGLRAGDRVVLVSESRPEWLISDMAILAAGATTSLKGNRPSLLWASHRPATAPGVAIERNPSRFSSLTTPAHPKLPTDDSPVSLYISGLALSGPRIGNPITPPFPPT